MFPNPNHGYSTYLELLEEGVGGVELHDVLHELLHCQRLVAVCNTPDHTTFDIAVIT